MSRPPIFTLPRLGVTIPAIRFNVVVLPAPAGPNIATNSRSAILSDRSSTPRRLPYHLVRPMSSTFAMNLSFYRPKRQATHQVFLNQQRQNDFGQRADERRGRHPTVVDRVGGQKARHRDR